MKFKQTPTLREAVDAFDVEYGEALRFLSLKEKSVERWLKKKRRISIIVAFGSVLTISLAEYFVDYEDEENKEAVKEAVSDFAWEYPLR